MNEPNELDIETEIARMKSETTGFCLDPRHSTPCKLPCAACEDECGEIAA